MRLCRGSGLDGAGRAPDGCILGRGRPVAGRTGRTSCGCYAVEGAYPESYEYLKEHYGAMVDEENYAVFYEVFASNIMPDIAVIQIGGQP